MSRATSNEARGSRMPPVGLVVAMAFAVAGGLGGTGFLIFVVAQRLADSHTVQAVAEGYLAELDAGRFDDAYERTSRDFQARQDYAQFRQTSKSSRLANQSSRLYSHIGFSREPGRPQATVHMHVAGHDDAVLLTLILVKEDSEWKIDRCYETRH